MGSRCSQITFMRGSTPVGIVAVRTPNSASGGKDPVVIAEGGFAGEMYDNLRFLRDLCGVETAFGILTTYNSWRFCWLDEEDIKAKDITKEDVMMQTLVEAIFELQFGWKEDLPTFQEAGSLGLIPPSNPPAKIDPRAMMTSKVFPYDHPELVLTIASIVLRMASSPVRRPHIKKGSKVLHISTLEGEMSWRELPVEPKASERLPPKETDEFYLLAVLGTGNDGRAWKACTATGEICVLKMLHATNDNGDERLPRKTCFHSKNKNKIEMRGVRRGPETSLSLCRFLEAAERTFTPRLPQSWRSGVSSGDSPRSLPSEFWVIRRLFCP